MKKECKHIKIKIRKHRDSWYPCVHCLGCGTTWSDPTRALYFLRQAKLLIRKLK